LEQQGVQVDEELVRQVRIELLKDSTWARVGKVGRPNAPRTRGRNQKPILPGASRFAKPPRRAKPSVKARSRRMRQGFSWVPSLGVAICTIVPVV